MFKVALRPIDAAVAVPPGGPLLPALLGKKLNVAMSCGGNGVCSTCHVRVREGMEDLSPMGAKERRTLALVADADETSRLACQAHVHGDGVVVELPRGMYLERADDLLALLGTRAPDNILHPIRGHVLIPQGKIITRTVLEQSRALDDEVRRMKDGLLGRQPGPAAAPPAGKSFAATGSGVAPPPARTPAATPPPPARTPAWPAGPRPAGRPPAAPDTAGPSAGTNPVPAPAPRQAPAGPPGRSGPVRAGGPPAAPAPTGPSTERAAGPAGTEVVSVSLAARRNLAAADGPAPPVVPATGTRVGKCLLMDCIGKGGLGVVYRALHTTLNIPVAVKFIRNRAGAAGFLDQFRDEARLLAQLNHPNVVRVLDFEDDPGLPYVVMEFVEGLSIQDLLTQTGRIWADRAVALLLHAVDGLEAAWRLGIVHRDVKPANILVGRDGTAKLVDLGLAVRVEPDGAPTSASGAHTFRVDGTVAYLCPERASNPAAVDHRADIYSLGVTAFQMVTGRLPYTGANSFEVMAAHACDPIPLAVDVAPDVPLELSAVIARMMAKRPEDRYQTYDEVRAALAALRADRAPVAVP